MFNPVCHSRLRFRTGEADMTTANDAKGSAQILVVEDDPVQRRLLKNAVERHGHIAHLAENGRVGLEMLKGLSGQINVIVLDLMMP